MAKSFAEWTREQQKQKNAGKSTETTKSKKSFSEWTKETKSIDAPTGPSDYAKKQAIRSLGDRTDPLGMGDKMLADVAGALYAQQHRKENELKQEAALKRVRDLTERMQTPEKIQQQKEAAQKRARDQYTQEMERVIHQKEAANIGKIGQGVVLQGADAFVAPLTSFAAAAEGLVTKPLGKLVGNEYLDESGLFYNLNEAQKRAAEKNQEVFQPEYAKGGRVGELVGKYGPATVAAIPQAALAYLTAGQSLAYQQSAAGLQAASAAAKGSGIASTVSKVIADTARNPSFQYSLVNAMGSEYEQARQDGASDLEAYSYAALSGLANAVVEVGGGIDVLPDKAGLRAWVKTMLDEGKEEVIQGAISQLAQNAVYGKENPLISMTDENAVISGKRAKEEFLGGAIVGGILGGVQMAAQSVAKRKADKIRQRIDTQTAVERTAEQSQNGDATEKAVLKAADETLQPGDMQTRQQGETQQEQQAAKRAGEIASASGLDAETLEKYPNLKKLLLGETVEPGAAAEEALSAVMNGEISKDQGRELTRRAISEAKAEAQPVQQTEATTPVAEERTPGYYGNAEDADAQYLDRLAKAAGVTIEKIPAAQAGNREGWIIGGKVYLSEGAEDVQRIVAKHEVTHQLQVMAENAYNNFRGYVENIYRQRGTLEQQLDGLKNLYRENNQELTDEEALDELAANYAGELLENESLIRRLAGEDRNLGQKILDAIRDILRRMRAAFGDQETRQLERAARLWEKALKETNEAYYQQGKRSESRQERNMYVGKRKDGRPEYRTDFGPDVTEEEKIRQFKERIATVFNLGAVKVRTDTKRIVVNGDRFTAQKNLYGDLTKGKDTTEFPAKINALYDMAHILEGARFVEPAKPEDSYVTNEPPKNEAHKNVKYWYKFKNNIVMDGAGYEVTFNIRDKGKDGQYAYLIEFKEDGTSDASDTAKNSLPRSAQTSHKDTIPQERRSVKGARELQKMIDSGALKTYEQITDAQNSLYQQERELADRKRAAVNNPELTKAMDEYSGMFNEMRELLPKRRNGTATRSELDRIEEIKTLREEKMAEIVDLQDQLGLKEIEEEETAIRETKEQLRVAADEAWEREGAEKEDAAIAKAGVSSADYFRKKALKAFKTTTNFNEAGYLLPDGKMLNFSGGERNHRYRDHREIGEIYEATNGVKALNRFLADGNIRVMAESPGIDLAAGVEPTYEQYAVLKKFINSNGKKEGKFFVDFSGKNGRREGNYSYTNGVNADRIINDIKYYYETGKIREQSAVSMFHERDSVKGARELQQQIDRLTKQNKRLQAQMKISNMPKASRKAVEQQATELRKAYGSTVDKAELTGRLEKLYDAMYAQSGGKTKKTMSWSEIREEARSIADAILAEATGNVNPKTEEYAQLRKELRGRKISIAETDRADLASMGGYNELRKQNMGSLTLSKEGTPVDVVYQELSDQYPELFPDDIYHPADQLMRISDVVQELKAVEGNPYAQDMENTAAYLAGEIEERFYDTPTEVEAIESQLSRQFEKQRRKERDANSRRLLQQQTAHEQVIRDMEERFREENRKRIANQSASERRETIRRHADRLGRKLVRPTDKQHVPAEMRGAALALVRYIDTESGYEMAFGPDAKYHRVKPGTELGAEITSRTAAARELQAEYKKLGEDTTLTIDPDMQDYLDEIAKMGNKRVADMTRAELDTVWRVMQVIEHTIGQANDLLEESRYRDLKQMADALKRDNGGKADRVDRAGRLGEADKLLNLDMLTPETYFSRMGEAGKDIFRQMRKARDRQTEILKEGVDQTSKLIKESGVSFAEADKELHTFDLDGGKITLSTSQLMELYALSKRKAALEHIYIGGLKPVEATEKGKVIGGSKPVKVTPEDVAEMIDTLTEKQRALVDGMQKYLSGDLARHGNEESRKVYGYDKFLEKNYWPIKVSSTEVASDPGKAATAKTIPGYGMTKALQPHAKNAVELRSAIDTYSRHLNQMATYAAWLGTNENITRLQNFKYETEDGHPDGNVKQLIEKVYGKNGNDYLQNLLSDIAQGTKAGADRSALERGLGQFKAAKVGGNLRVIIQQPTSILRAMAMVDPKYFASGKTTAGKGWEKAVKYAPIAQWKDWGYFEMDTGMSLRELMTGAENKLDKAKNALMAPAGAADSVAWGYLWNAVEAETADTHPELQKGTESFYRAVADRFSEVVDHTQVVDSVLHRSQIMRSSNYLNKVSTSFMSEPMKVYNMVVRDLYDLRGAEGEEAKKKAQKQLARTSASLIVSFAVNALAQSIVDGLRDDDREKKYLDKVADQWAGNFAENFNPIGYIPVAKDVLSLVQGYTLERSEMEGVAELITSMRQFSKATQGESQKTVLAAGLEAASKLGDLLGLPVSNLKRDAEAIVRTAMIAAGASRALYAWDKMVYSPEKAMSKFYDDMYRAMDTDQNTYELIYDDVLNMLQEQGMEPDEAAAKIKTNVENRMKKELGLEKTSSLPVRYSAPGESDVFDELMREAEAEGGSWAKAFGEETVEMARELDAMEDANKTQRVAQIGEMPFADDVREDALESILSDKEWARYQAAKAGGVKLIDWCDFYESVKDERTLRTGKSGTESQEDVEAVLKRMSLTDKQRTAIWNSYGWKAESPWS